ncbi:hypothetical protein HGD80_04080 [Paulownia witches'-broom phytoplasma]|uniref:Uncharacterized protein n=1 Tax=Paulownia witches'-broom phytoplasma TaxID=39647 RepID=A0ABX8TNF6_9MOLU|nr:hypothetical protein [Paulownia witches'-broom phytoplasma]QYC30914.1 hypothetical protein HGD80_04080 [Paulownia witches'-broom phytoplasma]GLH60591.1 hypothetical protein PAWBP_3290 [Paulownia witches'-broom phytoplasma]
MFYFQEDAKTIGQEPNAASTYKRVYALLVTIPQKSCLDEQDLYLCCDAKKELQQEKDHWDYFFTKPNFVTEFAQKYIKYHYLSIDVKNNNSTNLIKKVEDIKKIFYNKIPSSNNNTGLCIEAENQIYII